MTSEEREHWRADALIIGAGPSGLAAAIELRRRGVGNVLVLEREAQAGGIPRHCHHTGFGWRDRARVLNGPAYARAWTADAEAAGVTIATNAMVTGLDPATPSGASLSQSGHDNGFANAGGWLVSSPAGLARVTAGATLLATGARERSRAARLIPGGRGAGIMTTGQLQQLVHLEGRRLSGRALVIGAEHVSYSAVLTLRHAGAKVVAMSTHHEAHTSNALFAAAGRTALGVPLLASHRPSRIVTSGGAVTGVELTSLTHGSRHVIRCEIVILTGDWVPDNELARLAGLSLDPATRGPEIDTCYQTARSGLFAAGNLCHPVLTADVAALAGKAAGRRIAEFLARGERPAGPAPIVAGQGLAWVSPQRLRFSASRPALGGPIAVSPTVFSTMATITAWQGGKQLWTTRRGTRPGRPFHLPPAAIARARPHVGAVTITIGRPNPTLESEALR